MFRKEFSEGERPLNERFSLDYLVTANAQKKEAETLVELSALFDEVAKVADTVTDADVKIKLKLAAAVGREKIKGLKK